MRKLFILLAIMLIASCNKNPTSQNNTSPTASFTVSPASGTIATIFTFDASGSSDSEDSSSELQVRWDWENDGIWDTSYRNEKTINHQFESVGSYSVVLDVKDSEGLTNTITKTVSLSNTTPIASFSINPTSGNILTIFTFDASGCTDIEDSDSDLQVRWDWENDGTWDTNYSIAKTATHQYNTLGSHIISLEVKDTQEQVSTVTDTLSVVNTSPTASFTITPPFGTVDSLFTFDASGCTDIEDPSSDLLVRWDWENDGTWDTNYSTDKIATHKYNSLGTYIVKLEVKDTDALTNTTTINVDVTNADGTQGTVMDFDGNFYNTLQIGNQVWMIENLKVTHYRNGDVIPNVTSDLEWSNLTTGAYCSYDNDDSNINTYGLLYNWYTVNDSRNLAPEGWHIATDEEWKQLEMYLGMSQSEANEINYRGTDEGGKLKEEGTTHWNSPNTGATNESGFTALPSGQRGGTGLFQYIKDYSFFWTAPEYGNNENWRRELGFVTSKISRQDYSRRDAYSIRCIKD